MDAFELFKGVLGTENNEITFHRYTISPMCSSGFPPYAVKQIMLNYQWNISLCWTIQKVHIALHFQFELILRIWKCEIS